MASNFKNKFIEFIQAKHVSDFEKIKDIVFDNIIATVKLVNDDLLNKWFKETEKDFRFYYNDASASPIYKTLGTAAEQKEYSLPIRPKIILDSVLTDVLGQKVRAVFEGDVTYHTVKENIVVDLTSDVKLKLTGYERFISPNQKREKLVELFILDEINKLLIENKSDVRVLSFYLDSDSFKIQINII